MCWADPKERTGRRAGGQHVHAARESRSSNKGSWAYAMMLGSLRRHASAMPSPTRPPPAAAARCKPATTHLEGRRAAGRAVLLALLAPVAGGAVGVLAAEGGLQEGRTGKNCFGLCSALYVLWPSKGGRVVAVAGLHWHAGPGKLHSGMLPSSPRLSPCAQLCRGPAQPRPSLPAPGPQPRAAPSQPAPGALSATKSHELCCPCGRQSL